MIPEFVSWPKMQRHERPLTVTVTEKIDGTNGQIFINQANDTLWAGSRTRWVVPGDDNYGFATWAYDNVDELLKLGPGRHFGEWYGCGIQRGYGSAQKQFALFDVERWVYGEYPPPNCVTTVPVLYRGEYLGLTHLHELWGHLKTKGSYASPGFTRPEGLVAYFHEFRTALKLPMDK